MHFLKKNIVILLLLVIISFYLPLTVSAEGTISNIGTAVGSNAGSDAISWSNANPIMVDAYGHYIVPTESNGGSYYFSYSNDKGATWTSSSQGRLAYRPTAVYDSRHDIIHVLIEDTNDVIYRRFFIRRDSSYNITGFINDSSIDLGLEGLGACTTSEGGTYPMLLWKDDGANGILVAFWEVKKVCGATTLFETRASMRTLSNTSADGTASNWKALNGTDDNGTGAAIVDYNTLYSYSGTPSYGRKFTHSAMIRGGSGAKSEDIYYFNIDENYTFGYRRLGWNGSSNNWSGTWTSRATFGGNVNNGSGYNAKDELITKPVYDSNLNRVYVGIARYLGGGNGDTQTLFYVDSSDVISSGIDIYSAGGDAWFAPTLDIMYNSLDQKIYAFYQTSSRDPTNSSNTSTSFEGDGWYRTYDGSSLGTPQPFLTQTIGGTTYTVDIPIVYPTVDNNRIILFFRGDGSETPFVPPHYIFFGYISGGTQTTPTPTPLSGSPVSFDTYSSFDQSCATLTDTRIRNFGNGEVGLAPSLRDDFETPRIPYQLIWGNWTYGDWDGGSNDFTPANPNGTELIYSSGGAYMYDSTTYSKKILEFRAKFTAHSFQHIGWSDNTNFGTFIIFSTFNQPTAGHLYARTSSGTSTDLGSGYLGAYHTYRIEWGSDIKFYIDDALATTINENITTSLNVIASNNTTTSGSDLTLDWIQVTNFPTTTGTYQSCSINAGVDDAVWGALTFTSSTGSSTSVTIKTRTSSDNSTWSSWSSAITSGNAITSPVGRFIQFLFTLTGVSTETPTVNSLSASFASPTPSPTPTNSPTPTPTNTPTPTSTASTPTATPTSTGSGSSGGPSNEPTSQTSHLFITAIGSIKTLFISSKDDATLPKDTIRIDDRFVHIKGIADSNTTVLITLWPGNIHKRVEVNDDSSFDWSMNYPLEYGTYTVSAQAEEDGKVRKLQDFKIEIGPKLILTINKTNTPKNIKPEDDERTEEDEEVTIEEQEETEKPVETPKKELEIILKDTAGKPLSNTEVVLYSQPKKTTTDEQGKAVFRDVPAGEHTLVVNSARYTGSQKITVDEDPSVKKIQLEVKVEAKKSVSLQWFIFVSTSLTVVIVVLAWKLATRKHR